MKLPILHISSCPPLLTMKETGKRGMRSAACTDIKRQIVSQKGMLERGQTAMYKQSKTKQKERENSTLLIPPL